VNRAPSILYVGPLWRGGTCLQRHDALLPLCGEVLCVDTTPPGPPSLRERLFGAADRRGANAAILSHLAMREIDILWIDKGLLIRASTLAEARRLRPGCRIVGYSPDDMAARHNTSAAFRAGLRHYDIYFTTKSFGVGELLQMGCPRVRFVGNAFDPATHRPCPVSPRERDELGGPVGFIGQYERARARAIDRLARDGWPVRVWGPDWGRHGGAGAPLRIEGRSLWGGAYARAICTFDINLGFLRKANRDLSTTRSVEIPACGGFLLAERTGEHRELFEEGREAEFFGSEEELLEKTRFYLAHARARRRIAAAGRARCLRSGYSNRERLRWMLAEVREVA